MSRITVRRKVIRLTLGDSTLGDSALGDSALGGSAAGGSSVAREDLLAVEEPLEIRVGGRPLAVTMRTPGHDFDLAAGFLVSEGVITRGEQFSTVRYCAGATDEGLNTYNVLDVTLAPGVAPPDPSLERSFYTTSSCGLCGKASIDAVRTQSAYEVRDDALRIDATLLSTFPAALRSEQAVFDKTGGLHAAALFDGVTGTMLVIREDVGRHNAVDKVIGWALKEDRLPLRGTVLMVLGAGKLRADPEGHDGRNPFAGSGFGALVPGRRARHRGGDDARCVPAWDLDGAVCRVRTHRRTGDCRDRVSRNGVRAWRRRLVAALRPRLRAESGRARLRRHRRRGPPAWTTARSRAGAW